MKSPPSLHLGAAFLAVAVLLAACTGGHPSGDDARPENGTSSTGPTTTGTTSTSARQPERVPLVLAVHHTRRPVDVTRPVVERLLARGADSWSDLGLPGGKLDVLTAGTAEAVGSDRIRRLRTTKQAIRRVRKDPDTLAVVPATAVDETVRVLRVAGVHPLRSPHTYRPQVDAPHASGPVVTMTLVGDIMLGRRVGDALQRADDPAAVLRPLAERLSAADVTVGNLESTLSRAGSPTQGGDSFGARPKVRQGLRLAGFDVLSLANNHIGDFGERAMLRTFRRLRSSGIAYVGAGADLKEARSPVVVERHGTRIGLIATDSIGESPAATRSSPGTNRLDMPPRTGPVDHEALDRIASDITTLAERVDTVVVLPHWGTQYTNVPERSQRVAARRFVRAGADLVVGGHPHWVQGWEQMRGALVVHSLGNFVFDMDFMRQTQEGIFLEVVLWDGEVMAVEPVPYVIGDDFAPRPSGPKRSKKILALMRETSRGPYRP